ncbi:glycosyltransferase family 2 protein [Sulfurovum sp.]|uniref:glycosyltransferase family 2 protein n=1 Tax=Sulfurovum sp. TaxID=1969726 RepID=UPI00356B084A
MSITFSLIVATINRYNELESLLLSLKNQQLPFAEFEVVIVDQNQQGFLEPLIKEYASSLTINYIHSNKRGASLNRNIGLEHAKGSIVSFPDDDCTYYPDTLMKVKEYFTLHQNVDSLLGQIIDIDNNKKMIRNWPDEEKKISEHNFFMLYSQITVFTKQINARFDEAFGVGVKYGAYEDADYIFNVLQNSISFMYTPTVKVWHPEQNVNVMSLQKVKDYSMGFGAFCRKHLSRKIGFLFLQAIGFHLFKIILAIFTVNAEKITKSFASVQYRLKGFYEYK